MPRVSNQITIQITEAAAEQGRRKYSIDLEVEDSLFYLADAFVREGILKDFKSSLRPILRKGIADYIEQSRELLKQVKHSIESQQSQLK